MFGPKLNPRDVLDPSDVFFEQKAEWAKRLFRYLIKYVYKLTAVNLIRLLMNNAFRTFSRTRESQESCGTEENLSIDLFGGLLSIFAGSSTPRKVQRVIKQTTTLFLSFDFRNLTSKEDETTKELRVDKWLYPFAAMKLLLIANESELERDLGVREAVIMWTAVLIKLSGRAEATEATILKEAESRYGPIALLPK